MTDTKIVRVGIGVIALNDKGQYIMGRRKGNHGSSLWALPGGHLEFGETIEECACREMLEETGLVLEGCKIAATANHFFENKTKHYVSIFCLGRITGDPQLMEPHKTEAWQFFDDWHAMPSPQFVPYHEAVTKEAIEAFQKSR